MQLKGIVFYQRNLSVLKSYLNPAVVVESTDPRKRTAEFIQDFWKFNTQFLEITIDKFINYRLLDNESVTVWVFKELAKDKNHYHHWKYWTILNNTLKKMNLRVSQMKDVHNKAKLEADEASIEGLILFI